MSNYKVLNSLILDFIAERFVVTSIKPQRNKKGIYAFDFFIWLPERKFEIKATLYDNMLFLGTFPEIRMLSKDYKKIKDVFIKMCVDY